MKYSTAKEHSFRSFILLMDKCQQDQKTTGKLRKLMVMSIGWVAWSSVVECLRRVCESSSFKFRFKKKTRLSQHWTLGLQKNTMALSEV